jgi:hypothetical protein
VGLGDTSLRRVLIGGVVLLLAAPAIAAAATASGPPVLGGERHVIYKGTTKGNGRLEVTMAAGTNRVTYMTLKTQQATVCRRGGRTVRGWDFGLWQTPFRLDAKRHATRQQRLSTHRGDFERWDITFSSDWSRLSGWWTTRYHHNYLGICTAHVRLAATHVRPKHSWQLGRYQGVTSQGTPIAFTARWTPGDQVFDITAVSGSFIFPLDTGGTLRRDLVQMQDWDAMVEDYSTGTFSMRLSPGGKTQEQMSGSPEETSVDLHGVLTGARASGTAEGNLELFTGDQYITGNLGGVTFTASRVNGG